MSLFRDVCLLCRTRLSVELLATGSVCKCPPSWAIMLSPWRWFIPAENHHPALAVSLPCTEYRVPSVGAY